MPDFILTKQNGLPASLTPPSSKSWRDCLWRYGIPVGMVAVAAAIRWSLNGLFGSGLVFITFYPAVAAAGMLAGGRAGLVATALSALTADLLFVEPRWAFGANTLSGLVALGLFACGGVVISTMAGLLGRARKREWQAIEHAKGAEALRRSEEKFAKAFASSPVALVISRFDDGCVIDVNEAFAKLVGRTRRELLGKKSVESGLIEPSARAAMVRELSERGSMVQQEILLKSQGGESRSVLASAESLELEGEKCIIWTGFDISERKRAQQALQESEEQFRAMFNVASVGKAQADPATGRFLRVNAAFCEITGYTEAELLARTVADLTHPEDRAKDWASFSCMGKGEARGYETEKRYVRRDGQVVWVRVSANVLCDAAGRPWRTSAVIQDITARVQAELALRQSEEFFRIMFTESSAGKAQSDPASGRFLRVNAALCRITGYSEQELLGMTFSDVTHPDERKADFERFQALVRGSMSGYECEKRYVRRDGSVAWVHVTVNLIRDAAGQPLRSFAMIQDISARKRAEEALRQSEERLRLAQKAGGVGVYDWDLVTGNIVWTPELETIYGIQASEDPQQKQSEWGRHVHPEDLPKLTERTRQWLASAETEQEWEYRFIRPDGELRWIAGQSIVLRDPKGRPLRIIGVSTDVTQRKAFQAELQRLVDERTGKLKELVGELEHFSYSITHDMRAPLRGMQGFAEMMGEACQGCERQDTHAFLRRIQTSAGRMDALITDALNYSRAVRQELALEPVDVGALLRGMVDSYPELQADKARIDIAPDIPLVMGNEAGLTQVFSNLLGNAVKFVRPGQKPEIRVWAEVLSSTATFDPEDSPWVRLWVEDNGIGIPESMKPRVFDMFSRGHNSYAGTGIGLALVRKVVDRMGGKAGVQSEDGHGSRFWVDLKTGDVRQPGSVSI